MEFYRILKQIGRSIPSTYHERAVRIEDSIELSLPWKENWNKENFNEEILDYYKFQQTCPLSVDHGTAVEVVPKEEPGERLARFLWWAFFLDLEAECPEALRRPCEMECFEDSVVALNSFVLVYKYKNMANVNWTIEFKLYKQKVGCDLTANSPYYEEDLRLKKNKKY